MQINSAAKSFLVQKTGIILFKIQIYMYFYSKSPRTIHHRVFFLGLVLDSILYLMVLLLLL